MPRAFDMGTFLAHFRNQFYNHRDVLDKVDPSLFLEAYLQTVDKTDESFLSRIEPFKVRTTLSICYFLIKVELGDSENLWRVLVEAEQSLAQIAVEEAVLRLNEHSLEIDSSAAGNAAAQ